MASRSFWKKRLDPDARYGLRVTLFALAFLIVAIPFGLLLRQVTGPGLFAEIDAGVAESLHEWVRGSGLLIGLWKAVSFLGSPAWFYVVVGGVAIYLLTRGHPRLSVFLAATGLLGGLLNSTVKVWVDRPRPSFADPVADAGGMSFPSGHAMAVMVDYGALALVLLPMVDKKWRPAVIIVASAIVLAVGVSRLVLGVHYVTDVVGGYLLGAAWLSLSVAAFGIWRVERGKPRRIQPEEV